MVLWIYNVCKLINTRVYKYEFNLLRYARRWYAESLTTRRARGRESVRRDVIFLILFFNRLQEKKKKNVRRTTTQSMIDLITRLMYNISTTMSRARRSHFLIFLLSRSSLHV